MDLKAFWQSSRSTIISAAIAIVVIAGLFVLFNALPAGKKTESTDEQKQAEQKTNEQKPADNKTGNQKENGTKVTLPAKYTVVRGDNLWKISINFYGTGYNWVIIAQENKLANPNVIHAGNALTIPKAEIAARNHTVATGDSLWSISQRYYGTGYEWYKIRDANKDKVGTLANGRPLITPGQVLTIP